MSINPFFSNGTDILETHPARRKRHFRRRGRVVSPAKQEKKEESLTINPKVNHLADILPDQREAILRNLLRASNGDIEQLTQDKMSKALKPLPFVLGVTPNVEKVKLEPNGVPMVLAFIQNMKRATVVSITEVLECLV